MQYGYSTPGTDAYNGINFQIDPELEALLHMYMDSFLDGLLIFVLAVWALVLIYSVIAYVFQALALQTMAKRRGIRNPWLAWVPLGDMWLVGSLSDQYRYVTQGKVAHSRFVLLGLQLGTLLLGLVTTFSNYIEDTLEALGLLVMVSVPQTLLGVASMVFFYIALYHVFSSCNPEKRVGSLILSILLSPATPFILFANRKLDLGMPPRREDPADAAAPEVSGEIGGTAENTAAGLETPAEEPAASAEEPAVSTEDPAAPVEETACQEPENGL